MIPLYRDPWFTFRFADDRLIGRFCLEDVAPGQKIAVFKIDPETGFEIELLATATVGADGWVVVAKPIAMRAGEAFIAVPEQTS